MNVKNEAKGNLTSFKIVDVYEGVPSIGIKFTPPIVNRRRGSYPYPAPHLFIMIKNLKRQEYYTK